MDSLTYTVIKEIVDIAPQHSGVITAQCRNILSTMKVGDTIVAKDFIKKVMPNFSKTSRIKHLTNMGYRHLRCGKKIGMLRQHRIVSKPKKHRRAISPIIATILLVGISVAGIAVILPLMISSTDTLNQSTACYLLNVKLYDITTTSQAYFIVNLENLGSTDVTDAQITFFDDLDAEYGFYENSLELYPESSLMRNQTFAASITTDNTYLVNATITANDGSRASCIQSITAR